MSGWRCDFKWQAPYLHAPPSMKVTHIAQECSLEKGHEGDHRSLTNVTAPNEAGYDWYPGKPIHPHAAHNTGQSQESRPSA